MLKSDVSACIEAGGCSLAWMSLYCMGVCVSPPGGWLSDRKSVGSGMSVQLSGGLAGRPGYFDKHSCVSVVICVHIQRSSRSLTSQRPFCLVPFTVFPKMCLQCYRLRSGFTYMCIKDVNTLFDFHLLLYPCYCTVVRKRLGSLVKLHVFLFVFVFKWK